MGQFLTETAVRRVLIDLLDEGESIEAVARGTDLLGRPVFVAKTDKRGLVVRLSKSFEVKEQETIPLGKLDKKLKRMALVKGLYLSPPGEPVFRSEKETSLYQAARSLLKEQLEPEESLVTIGMARDGDVKPRYFYVAFTDRRVMLARLSGKREIEDVESFPLSRSRPGRLAAATPPVPADIPSLASQEQRLYLQTKDGTERMLLLTDFLGFRRDDAPD